jgi:hypothetical protein
LPVVGLLHGPFFVDVGFVCASAWCGGRDQTARECDRVRSSSDSFCCAAAKCVAAGNLVLSYYDCSDATNSDSIVEE